MPVTNRDSLRSLGMMLTTMSRRVSPPPPPPPSVSLPPCTLLPTPLLQVWFIIAESVASACYGVARHVGERFTPKEICGSFEKMYKIFFGYLELGDQQKHFRFAYVWNEVQRGTRRWLWQCYGIFPGMPSICYGCSFQRKHVRKRRFGPSTDGGLDLTYWFYCRKSQFIPRIDHDFSFFFFFFFPSHFLFSPFFFSPF